jgi:hypothetical protein
MQHQFMIYHFTEWDENKAKWIKKPVGLQGEQLHLGGGIPTATDRAAVAATVARLGDRYRVGLWLQPGMFLLDLDEDAVDATGQLTPLAASMAGPLIAAGCYFEGSSSGRGAHVIGRYTGELPAHRVNIKAVHPHEFFTSDRGCVLSLEATAGSWDVDVTPLLAPLLREHFPPRATSELQALTTGPRAAWRGPADDEQLILRMLGASGSALSRMQGKTSLRQLWEGNCEHDSEADMALAAHLAFWTGADGDRMERLMRRSGLRRPKWDETRRESTYLRQTIDIACSTTVTVYAEPVRVDTYSKLLGTASPMGSAPPVATAGPAAPLLITPTTQDWYSVTEDCIRRVNSAGTLKELFEDVLPSISMLSMPAVHVETVAGPTARKLESMGSKQPMARIRALLAPPKDITATLLDQAVPEWAQTIVYVMATDSYFDTATTAEHSVTGLRAKFSRYMPMKANGQREDPAQFLQDRWNMITVDDIEYRPNMGGTFEFDGRLYANEFRASSIPTPVMGSDECAACIGLFLQHLYAVVSQRDELYHAVLGWIAHNAQFPGRKIRWSPLLQGSAGVGKSIFTELFNAMLGRSNVKSTSSATLSNSGGFTDWAVGAALNVIEELKLDSKESRRLYNNMKTYIADDDIDINRKGRASGRKMINVTNHWANTNYRGTLPIDMGDRRWCVIFTPWENADAAARAKGLGGADALPAFFNRLGVSMRSEPGAWRSWLLGIDLSTFNPDGRAPHTEEREAMRQGSGDFLEQTIEDCIARGGRGVGIEAFCSHSLMGLVQISLGEKPDSRAWNRILGELGYQQHPKTVWWNNRSRRIWSKISRTNDELRDYLDKTSQPAIHL